MVNIMITTALSWKRMTTLSTARDDYPLLRPSVAARQSLSATSSACTVYSVESVWVKHASFRDQRQAQTDDFST